MEPSESPLTSTVSLVLHLPMMGLDTADLSVMTHWDNTVLPSSATTRRRRRVPYSSALGTSGNRSAATDGEGQGDASIAQDATSSDRNDTALNAERLERMAKVKARLDRRSAAAVQAAANRRAMADAFRASVANVKVPTAKEIENEMNGSDLLQSGPVEKRKAALEKTRQRQQEQFSVYL